MAARHYTPDLAEHITANVSIVNVVCPCCVGAHSSALSTDVSASALFVTEMLAASGQVGAWRTWVFVSETTC